MELTGKEKIAFQELADWARKHKASIQIDQDTLDVQVLIDDACFVLAWLAPNHLQVDRPAYRETFFPRQK